MAVQIDIQELADGLASFTVSTEGGHLAVLAGMVIDEEHNRVTLTELDIEGEGVWKNDLGPVKLRRIIREIMEHYDVDEIVIEGAVRVTGAGPGRLPGPIRFARKTTPDVVPSPK